MNDYFVVDTNKPFSESLLWQLNRDYYSQVGITAWSDNVVPHQVTSSSMVGKTYAQLILSMLKDIGAKGKTSETVYILELGAGHGRLAFHILKHLQQLQKSEPDKLPNYCYILSDIVEDNLTFFNRHPQLQEFFKQGVLDYAYFDAIDSKEIHLRYADRTITAQSLHHPIVGLGNYFFDSLPTDLFFIANGSVATCNVALHSKENPKTMSAASLIQNIHATYHKSVVQLPYYEDVSYNQFLETYKNSLSESYLFFPKKGMECLNNLKLLSKEGLLLLSMDKGYHELQDLDQKPEPYVAKHGSLSFWVNFHALGAYCDYYGGKTLFPTQASFHLEVCCLLFVPDASSYARTVATFNQVVDDFGPDDFITMKKMAYLNVNRFKIIELITLIRLSAYDSTFFEALMPRIKQLVKSITFSDRKRLAQTFHNVWNMYFNINEKYDLPYELGGLCYDLGFYNDALVFFEHAVKDLGEKADIYYNQALCYYQLRQDALFIKTVQKAKRAFPGETLFDHLDTLDINAQ